LTESQRASVAAKLVNATHGGDRKSEHIKGSIDTLISIDKAAEMLSVGSASVKRAMVVQQHGSPELIAAVERGEVAVSRAATVAKTTPKEKQINEAKKKPKKKEGKQKKKIEEKAGKPKSVAVQKQERDADWVEDFVYSMSRINRLKLLLKEITDSERQIVKDWLSER
jgi:outer membrane translocation and assembly module TamA